MAKSAARQVTNQIVRGMLGVCWGGEKDKSDVICAPHPNLSPKGRGDRSNSYLTLSTIIRELSLPLFVHQVTIFSLTATAD